MADPHKLAVVASLGTGQTLAWASSYYLPALLAQPMARDLNTQASTVFAAFSIALVISALVGPIAGRAIDRHGGRPVLVGTNLLFALSLVLLANAHSTPALFLAWGLMGVAMGAGLYDAAFATLVKLYGQDSRSAITGITLIAGFASTLGWPLTAWAESSWGWREACEAWALAHLIVGLPLNLLLPKTPASTMPAASQSSEHPASGTTPHDQRACALLLSVVFGITWFISTAMAAHLPRILEDRGLSLGFALALASLVGPAQVGARLLEFGLLRKIPALLSTRIAAAAHPIGAIGLLIAGAPLAGCFTVLHGAGNGVLTIAKGTLPLAVFGPARYGARQGALMAPARLAQAAAPLTFGLAIDLWGANALWLSAGLGLVAFLALGRLKTLQQGRDQEQATATP